MTKEQIEYIERKPTFKLFIRRSCGMGFSEYMRLFGEDWNKRKTAVEWFIETYPRQAK